MATDIIAASPSGIASALQAATGAFVASGNAMAFPVGFNPRRAFIVNETQNVTLTKLQGNAVNTCIKETAAAQTIDTTGLVLFPADAGLNEPGASVLVAASFAAAGDKICWLIGGERTASGGPVDELRRQRPHRADRQRFHRDDEGPEAGPGAEEGPQGRDL